MKLHAVLFATLVLALSSQAQELSKERARGFSFEGGYERRAGSSPTIDSISRIDTGFSSVDTWSQVTAQPNFSGANDYVLKGHGAVGMNGTFEFRLGGGLRITSPKIQTQRGLRSLNGLTYEKTTRLGSFALGPLARVETRTLLGVRLGLEVALGLGITSLEQTILEGSAKNQLVASAIGGETAIRTNASYMFTQRFGLTASAGFSRVSSQKFKVESVSGELFNGIAPKSILNVRRNDGKTEAVQDSRNSLVLGLFLRFNTSDFDEE